MLPVDSAGDPDLRDPSIAGVHDYWLGGRYHSDADRDFADRTAIVAPQIPYLVRTQRALLGRMVRYLAGRGIRQFLDLGSGVPSVGHVHEVAQAIDPTARVVYVDTDPDVVAYSKDLLALNDNVALVDADVRDPRQVLDAPETRRLLDLDQPTAVLLIATLQHIPDTDDPAHMVTAYRDALSPGSYLALSHYGPDEYLVSGQKLFERMHLGEKLEVTVRDPESLRVLFAGLDLVSPGIVPVVSWRPDPDDDIGNNPERHPIHAGLGRKP
ncbi:SAM-dependent methyltransferase [Actinophytocola sp.]|uniref:SAM-dependent methyltransferase n=1 Tax=Actinophytocola sp. TaxID=1872138 RepID=UPI002ED43619